MTDGTCHRHEVRGEPALFSMAFKGIMAVENRACACVSAAPGVKHVQTGYVGYLGPRRVLLPDFPLSDFPLSDFPLSDFPLSDFPLSDFARRIYYPEVEKKGRESCEFHSPARADSSAALVESRRSAGRSQMNSGGSKGRICPHNLNFLQCEREVALLRCAQPSDLLDFPRDHFCGMAEMLTPVDYTRSTHRREVWLHDTPFPEFPEPTFVRHLVAIALALAELR